MAKVKFYNKETGKWEYADSAYGSGGTVTDEQIAEAVRDALAQAKANGDFNGDPGPQGERGEPGYTPVKGVDYFDGEPGQPGEPGKDYVLTEADKTEIAEQAAQIVNVGESGGGSTDAVQYVEQHLTEEQQMQARKNLGLYGKSAGKIDIAPEQQITFDGGRARIPNMKDPCYDLELCTDPGTMAATLEINGEVIDGEINYRYAAAGTFGAYLLEYGVIVLGNGATVQDGETVTIRLYAAGEQFDTIPAEFLPKDAANAVSYAYQVLSEDQKSIARNNIDVYSAYQKLIWSDYKVIPGTGLALTELDLAGFCEIRFKFTEKSGVFSSPSTCTVSVNGLPDDDYKQWFEILLGHDTLKRVYGYVTMRVWNGELFIHIENNQDISVELQSITGIGMEYKFDN